MNKENKYNSKLYPFFTKASKSEFYKNLENNMPQISGNKLKKEYPSNSQEHKKGVRPNYSAIHGDRHQRAKLHGESPARQNALINKMSLDDMHGSKGTKTFAKMTSKGKEDFAKRDRDESRAQMIKKLEAAGDYESAKMLKG